MYTANHYSVHRGLYMEYVWWGWGVSGGGRSGKASQNRIFKPQMVATCSESMNNMRMML